MSAALLRPGISCFPEGRDGPVSNPPAENGPRHGIAEMTKIVLIVDEPRFNPVRRPHQKTLCDEPACCVAPAPKQFRDRRISIIEENPLPMPARCSWSWRPVIMVA